MNAIALRSCASELYKIAGLRNYLPTQHAEHVTDLAGLGLMAAGSAKHLHSQLTDSPDSPAANAGADLAGLGAMAAPSVAALTSLRHQHAPGRLAGGGSRLVNAVNLAGLGALGLSTADKLQAHIRARKGEDAEKKMLLSHGAHKALELGGYGGLAAPVLAQGRHMGVGGLSLLAGYGALAAPVATDMEDTPARTGTELAGLGLLAAPSAIGMMRGH